jgi:hypothetical protein
MNAGVATFSKASSTLLLQQVARPRHCLTSPGVYAGKQFRTAKTELYWRPEVASKHHFVDESEGCYSIAGFT